eukprot:5131786-Pyramimonas_sp.AAC.1
MRPAKREARLTSRPRGSPCRRRQSLTRALVPSAKTPASSGKGSAHLSKGPRPSEPSEKA